MAGIRGKVVLSISKLVSSRNTGATFPDLWGFFGGGGDFVCFHEVF